MTLEELQELLEEALEDQDFDAGDFEFVLSKKNELIIHTRLRLDDSGDLVSMIEDEEEEIEDFEGSEDFEPLEDEDLENEDE